MSVIKTLKKKNFEAFKRCCIYYSNFLDFDKTNITQIKIKASLIEKNYQQTFMPLIIYFIHRNSYTFIFKWYKTLTLPTNINALCKV